MDYFLAAAVVEVAGSVPRAAVPLARSFELAAAVFVLAGVLAVVVQVRAEAGARIARGVPESWDPVRRCLAVDLVPHRSDVLCAA